MFFNKIKSMRSLKTIPRVLLLVLMGISATKGDVIARVVKFEGNVFIKRLGMSTFSDQVKVGDAIVNGDAIKVGESSFAAVIYIDDRSVIKIKENSKFSFMDSKNTRTIDLVHGTLLNKINTDKRKKAFRIQTPVSVASIKGTEFAAIVSQKGTEEFVCKEGSFEVLNMISGQTVKVNAGQKAFSNATGDLVQAVASPKDYPSDPEFKSDFNEFENFNIEEEAIEYLEEETINKIAEPEKITPENSAEIEFEKLKTKKEIDSEVVESLEVEKTEKQTKPEPPPKPFSMGLGIGSATVDGILYNQLAFRPEIYFMKVGVGLDLILYVDNEGNIKKEEWDIENDPSLLLDKILYIRYGRETDVFWAKYGSLEGVTFGYGGLLNNYSNMMEFPSVRRVGLNTGVNLGPVSSNFFIANFKDLSRGGTLSGLRLNYRVSKDFPLSFGINYIIDGNMFSGFKDRDNDSYPDVFDDFPDSTNMWNDSDGDGIPDPHYGLDSSIWDIDADGNNIIDTDQDSILLKATPFSIKNNTAKTNGLSFDIGYPIVSSKLFTLKLYAEYNKLNFPGVKNIDSTFIRTDRSGSGITFPGIMSSIFGILNLSLEYRIINGSYIPQFFDQAYDLNRVVTSTLGGNTIIQTKDMAIFNDYNDDLNSSGLYGSGGLNLFNLVSISASYANMKSDTTELKSFASYLNLNTENIPKISSAMAYYQRNNDANPFDFENPTKNTIMGYRIGYELSKGVSLIWDFRQFYRDDGTGKIEPIQQTTIETSFNF